MTKYSLSHTMLTWYYPTDCPGALAAAYKFKRAVLRLGGRIGCKRGTTLIYGRSPERVEADLLPVLPPDGELRLLGVTDIQIQKSRNHWGKPRLPRTAVA
jgi:hypothetical protein